jgi:xanthosine utilization system XapX-like protein
MRPAPGLWTLRSAGFLAALLFFILIYFVPGAWSPPTLVIVGLLGAYFVLCLRRLRRWTERAGWGRRQELALITGALTPNIIIVSFQPGGEPFVTIPFFALLVWLAFRYRSVERGQPVPPSEPLSFA